MADTDPRARLDEIKARADEATPGPWEVRDGYPRGGGRVYEPSGFPLPGCFNCGENDAVYEEGDAEFIAHARTDLPAMAAALVAVLDVIDRDAWDQQTDEVGIVTVVNTEDIRAALTDALGGGRG